jgi:hypothetical protein
MAQALSRIDVTIQSLSEHTVPSAALSRHTLPDLSSPALFLVLMRSLPYSRQSAENLESGCPIQRNYFSCVSTKTCLSPAFPIKI